MYSPGYVQTSLAAAMTLGFAPGRFHRDAKLTGLNLLLKYDSGCRGRCSYCGLSGNRVLDSEKSRTFIRVKWPTLALDEIIDRTTSISHSLQRVCLSMVTSGRAKKDTLQIVESLHNKTDLPISVLIAPTIINDQAYLRELLSRGAERIGIAVDCATEVLFDAHRGHFVGGPHDWDQYWKVIDQSVETFGEYMVGIHLIVGLGETDKELVGAILQAQDRGALTHLFSFFPEQGSLMQDINKPEISRYRHIQLARYLINSAGWKHNDFYFNDQGKLIGFARDISQTIEEGIAFMTSGCPGQDGLVSCNRPFGNDLPSQPIRNFPFIPDEADISDIKSQLAMKL